MLACLLACKARRDVLYQSSSINQINQRSRPRKESQIHHNTHRPLRLFQPPQHPPSCAALRCCSPEESRSGRDGIPHSTVPAHTHIACVTKRQGAIAISRSAFQHVRLARVVLPEAWPGEGQRDTERRQRHASQPASRLRVDELAPWLPLAPSLATGGLRRG